MNQDRTALVDIIDHLIDRGTVVVGDVALSLADVDLVYVKLQLVLSSVQALHRDGHGDETFAGAFAATGPTRPSSGEPRLSAAPFSDAPAVAQQPYWAPSTDAPPREAAAPGTGGQVPEAHWGLARLVLTLTELLRQLMERQAIRRTESGNLSDEQVERLGVALMELDEKMTELRNLFGLKEEEVNIDLGPAGRLV